mgnify:CR=1 FL=1
MPAPFPGYVAPAAGTEAPLEMLAACHGRVQRQCATLKRLVAHVTAHGADAQAQSAASGVMSAPLITPASSSRTLAS